MALMHQFLLQSCAINYEYNCDFVGNIKTERQNVLFAKVVFNN